MKSLVLGLLVASFSVTALADMTRLLSCNPPMWTRLQEVTVLQDNEGKIFRRELNMAGSLSELTEITKSSWAKKDLSWVSEDGGKIHLKRERDGQGLRWVYNSKMRGIEVMGTCEE